MATSGTVSTYVFDQRKVIDHAMRMAGRSPEMVSAEDIEIAQDLIYLILGEWVSAGFPLWTRQFQTLGITLNGSDVPCNPGTMDVLHAYWRILQPYRGTDTLSTGATDSLLFGGQPNSDVVITGTNPSVTVNYGSPGQTYTIGVLPGSTGGFTGSLNVNVSSDGVNYTTFATLPNTTFIPGQWAYFDLNPFVYGQWVQLQNPGVSSWSLNQLNFGQSNGVNIELGILNIDDYYNLPNLSFPSPRPNSLYVDRQVFVQNLKIWPVPDINAFYNGFVTALVRRYIQDPGSMTNQLEVPQRGLAALIARLARRLIDELADPASDSPSNYFGLMAKQQKIQQLDANASKAEALFWSEERNIGPIRIVPSLSAYTK